MLVHADHGEVACDGAHTDPQGLELYAEDNLGPVVAAKWFLACVGHACLIQRQAFHMGCTESTGSDVRPACLWRCYLYVDFLRVGFTEADCSRVRRDDW